MENRLSMHPHKPHATSQPSQLSHTHRPSTATNPEMVHFQCLPFARMCFDSPMHILHMVTSPPWLPRLALSHSSLTLQLLPALADVPLGTR